MNRKTYEVVYKNGNKFWYLNGKQHREDGPACERASGRREWYLNGQYLTDKEFNESRNNREKNVA